MIECHCSYCGAELSRNAKSKTGNYFCSTEHKALWQRLQREKLGYTKDWLIHQYFDLGKDCNQIGKEIGRNGKRVWEWFHDYEIEIQHRGQSKKQQFKKGHKLGVGRIQKEVTREKIRQKCIARGAVPFLVNGKHWLKQPGIHSTNWMGGITPERQAVYSSDEWKECVKSVWERDNATCQMCGKHQAEQRNAPFHIHHLTSFKNKALRFNVDNLVLLCPDCHRWVHSRKNKNKDFIKNQ